MSINSTPLFSDFCKTCGSLHLSETLEPNDSVHHARLSCDDCLSFVRWVPKPKNSQVTITKLLQSSNLVGWERQFLKIVAYNIPTTAENIVIQRIAAKLQK